MKKYLLIYILLLVPVYAQISPGDLTDAHKQLEGISHCTQCHELGEEVTNAKCLECHTEIKNAIQNNIGFHSSNEVSSKKCYQCHSEHHGRKFEIIHFNKKTFDHSQTGFKLTGKHKKIKCEDCHKKKFITVERFKKKEKTYLGLSTNCTNCHEDVHQGTLGNNCQKCHNSEAFKPAALFKHNDTDFKLSGAHADLKCNKCHKIEVRNNKSFQVFSGIEFHSCANCHKDVHKGKFGANCSSCHTPESFKKIKNIKKFDHSKTNYPLIGKHQFVKCKSCHKNNLASKPKHNKCIDCHSDFHKGSFTENGKVTDCSKCHTVKGFVPSLYTVDQHNKSGFPLTGSHLAIPCIECHQVAEKYKFVFKNEKCVACHENIHKNKISQKYFGNDECKKCHNTATWKDINFDHSKTKFSLSGKHERIDCKACHFIKEGNEVKQIFADLNTSCQGCHKDVHHSQFVVNGKTDCSRCHAFENWEPVKFDHSSARFQLNGAHAKVKCSACHKKVNTPSGTFIKYKFEDIKCTSCHSS